MFIFHNLCERTNGGLPRLDYKKITQLYCQYLFNDSDSKFKTNTLMYNFWFMTYLFHTPQVRTRSFAQT